MVQTLPEVWIDGRDLRIKGNVTIRRAFAVNSGRRIPIAVNNNKLKFSSADAVGVEYFCKYGAIQGFSKAYFSDSFEPLGFELEVMPVDIADDSVELEVAYKGKPVMCELKVRNGKKLTLIFMDDYHEKIKLERGLNVITARYAKPGGYLLSTLTIKI